MAREQGQAAIEWVGLALLVSLSLGALISFGPAIDGRSFGGFLAHRLVCAVKGRCADGERELARAYGESGAALVREHAPNLVYEPGERQLPVDWRRCRRPTCANAPDDRGIDVHRSARGARATVFTRVIRRGGRTYIQYWLYYPDSNSAIAGSDKAWEYRHLVPVVGGVLRALGDYPGYHRDDWESYFVRIDPDGQAWVRASSHGHWQGCKLASCRNSWTAQTGWTRVSRGSHAGHIPLRSEPTGGGGPVTPMPSRFAGERRLRWRHFPQLPGVHIHERTTTAEGLRLIPLETRDHAGYRPLDEDIRPPWQKDAYDDPESHES